MAGDTLPTLAFSNPLCPVCLEETDANDYAYSCYDCGIQWSDTGTEPEWLNPADGQCSSTYTPTRGLVAAVYRCMRMGNHGAKTHEHPDLLQGWKTGDPGVSEVAE